MIDNLKLIELVQEREFLYNKALNEFRNVQLKDAAWQEIAEKLGCSFVDARRRWCSLRDRFTKEIRMRIQAEQGKIVLIKDAWSLYDAMYFIKDYIKYNNYNDSLVTTQAKSVQFQDDETTCDETESNDPYAEYKTVENLVNVSETDEDFSELTPAKRLKESNSEDEQYQNIQAEEIVQTAVVERVEHYTRLPNAQVLGISRIVIHKLNNLETVLQNESIETILAYLSAMERYQSGLAKTKPHLNI